MARWRAGDKPQLSMALDKVWCVLHIMLCCSAGSALLLARYPVDDDDLSCFASFVNLILLHLFGDSWRLFLVLHNTVDSISIT